MAGLFRQGGANFDDLFDAGTGPTAPNLRAGGSPLQYAPLSAGTKRPDVGYRVGGSDVSNLWAAKGSVTTTTQPSGTYTASVTAFSSAPGTVTASCRVSMLNDGTWSVQTVEDRPGGGAGTVTRASGTWLPAGNAASDYQVQYEVTGTGGNPGPTISNPAASYAGLETSRTFSSTNTRNAVTTGESTGNTALTLRLRRISTGLVTTSTLNLNTTATGFG